MWLEHDQTKEFAGHRYNTDTYRDGLQYLINEHGVKTPGLARLDDDGKFEVISGHRRRMASTIRGDTGMWYEVTDISHEEARLLVHDLNKQRVLTPKERAEAIMDKLEIYEQRVGRPAKDAGKENDCQNDTNKKAVDIVAEQEGLKPRVVYRLARIGRHLGPELMAMYDNDQLKQGPAEHLSWLSPAHQVDIAEFMKLEQRTISPAQAVALKQLSQDGKLNDKTMAAVFLEPKPQEKQPVKVPNDVLEKYADKLKKYDTPQKWDKLLDAALSMYFTKLEQDKAAKNQER